MADPSNGQMTIYSNDMKSYGMRTGSRHFPRHAAGESARRLDGRPARVTAAPPPTMRDARRPIWPKRLGRPVRIQWMRNEETAWDTKAPAFAVKMRGGLDAAGNLVAYDYNARAADYNHVGYNEPDTVLIAQLMGIEARQSRHGQRGHAFGNVRDSQPPHDHRRW